MATLTKAKYDKPVIDWAERLALLVKSATPYVLVETTDIHRFSALLLEPVLPLRAMDSFKTWWVWDMLDGLYERDLTQASSHDSMKVIDKNVKVAHEALRRYAVTVMRPFSSVLLLHNPDTFLSNNAFIHRVISAYEHFAQAGKVVIMVGAPTQVPVAIEPYITRLPLPAPGPVELKAMIDNVVEFGDRQFSEKVARAALGLTAVEFDSLLHMLNVEYEANQNVDKSITDYINPARISEEKNRILKNKSQALQVLEPGKHDSFDFIVGLTNVKEFMTKMALSGVGRGVLLTGVPGNAKTCLARALGPAIDVPVVQLEVSRLFNHYVGRSEANLRNDLKVIEAMSPCVVLIDEIEKSFKAATSANDSGVALKLLGILLQWLESPRDGVYIVATSNDITGLPPELTRSERWDATFFIDYPNAQAKRFIWKLWRKEYGLHDALAQPDDSLWTGADIKSCCRLARAMKETLVNAAEFVVPVSKSFAEHIQLLRDWARDRAVWASWDVPVSEDESQSNTDHETNVVKLF